MRNPLRALIWWVGAALARANRIDLHRAERTTDLAWPRIVTGLARISQSTADLAMVGAALGPAAIAGVGVASPFWMLAVTVGGGVAGGAISQVSQRHGAGDEEAIGLVVKQSALAVAVLAVPFVVAFAVFARPLVALVGGGPEAVAHGAAYLRVLAFAFAFGGLNLVGSRALVGADDARAPMVLRGGGAVLNVGLNAVLIFGLGMGVVGAALGTVVANGLVTAGFAWGFLGGRVPGVGRFPVTVDPRGPWVDRELLRELGEISVPIAGRGVAASLAQFPLLAVVAGFGPGVLAAFVVSRRVRGLLNTPGWGFGLASNSLVGQQLGAGDEGEAEAYGWDILRFSLTVYFALAVLAVVFARPVARAFVDDPALVPTTTVFVRIAAVSVMGFGLNGAAAGPLRASGDTRWPLYGTLVGMYLVTVPVAALGLVTPLGVGALYLALLTETLVPAAVTYHRFRSGAWKVRSRRVRPEAEAAD